MQLQQKLVRAKSQNYNVFNHVQLLMSFAIENEISDIQISPSNASTSVATRIIFSVIRTIYHGHTLLNQSVLNQQLLFQLLFTVSVSQ